jgi:hypothetical protein
MTLRRTLVLLAAVMAAFVLGRAYPVRGSHQFTDVPGSAIYHNAVEWIVNRAVTFGCVAGLYCPNDFVTRGQMALFMNRLGVALTPVYVQSLVDLGAIDVDASPLVCGTGPHTPTFPQRAYVHVKFISIAGGAGSIAVLPIYSTNGGATWSNVLTTYSAVAAGAAGEWQSASAFMMLDLAVGVPYNFGIQLQRASGFGDPSASACEIVAQIVNRNSATTPLSVPQRSGGGGRSPVIAVPR